MVKKREERRYEKRSENAGRTEYERDRDRILYSDAFRTLGGIAQVAHSQEGYNYHTRLTHSLKVSQVGRRLAQYINEKTESEDLVTKPSVVSAAALAHDIGHPPFGHPAEDELNEIIANDTNVDVGFEGNPQSLRIVSKVETDPRFADNHDRGRSLNLTRATLNAMLKYPWKYDAEVNSPNYDTKEKFGYYESDEEMFSWIREYSRKNVRSPEAVLMDWADDVTYAVHDVIDFYKTGLIPLHDILEDSGERERFLEHFREKNEDKAFMDAFELEDLEKHIEKNGLDIAELKSSYKSTRKEDALLDRFRSEFIEDFLKLPDTISIVEPEDAKSSRPAASFELDRKIIDIDPQMKAEVEFLKELTFYYVINNGNLVSQQQGHRRVVRCLFEMFLSASGHNEDMDSVVTAKVEEKVIPQPFREELSDASSPKERCRFAADAISMMTEQQAISLFRRATGKNLDSVQEEIL